MMSEADRDARYEVLKAELAHQRELMKLREEALKLQASEYERRLSDLNHEAAKLTNMQNSYWPREVAEKYVDSQAKAMDALNGRIGAVEKSLWRISGALAIIYIVIQFLQRFKIF
jgi:hypothetical protein